MKKKTVLICLVIMTMFFCTLSFVMADTGDTTVNLPTGEGGNESLRVVTSLGKAWATIVVIVQILSIGLIVFAGLRYMFASADKKADIKRRIDLASNRGSYCFCGFNNNTICC